MLLSLRKNGLTSLSKEVRVFKVRVKFAQNRRRTNAQQLTGKMVWSFSFYSLLFSFRLFDCDPKVLRQGPETSKVPKVVRRGCKRCFGPRGSKCLPRVFCTTKTLFCTGATLFRTSARGCWRPWSKRPFAPSPNHFGHFWGFGPL